MAKFYRYETVEIPLVFRPDGVLTGYEKIVVSLSQGGTVKVNKTEEDLNIDVENNKITLSLSQEETAMFAGGDNNSPIQAKIQVNIYYNNNERNVSTIGSIDVYNNLYEKVIDNE